MSQRRILTVPHLNNPPSMDSKLTDHPKPTSSSSNSTSSSDLSDPCNRTSYSSSIVNHLSRLTLNQKARVSKRSINHSEPQPPSHLLDIRLQAKAMSASAMVDSSKFSLPYLNPQKAQNNGTARKPVKGSSKTIKSAKQMHNKECSRRELERLKLQGSGMKAKKDVDNVEMLVDSRTIEDREEDEEARMEGWLEGKRSSVSSVAVIGGRRRSFCGPQVELRDFLATNGVKVVSADMPPFMQIHAVGCARKTYDSMEKFTSKTLALALKKEFDGVYGPAWHCIVGTSFGSFVTHSVGGFLYISMDHKLYILLFKTTVQRAD